MKQVWMGLAGLSAVAALVGFFLPWASLDLREPGVVKKLESMVGDVGGKGILDKVAKGLGRITATVRRGTQTVTGRLPSFDEIPKQVSGVQIPQIANQEHAQVAIALLELFTNTRQHIGVKSYAVYLVPGIALLCGLLLMAAGGRLPVSLGVALVCALIAAVGFWKVLTTDTSALLLTVTIGAGIWLSLWAYVGLALAALARAFAPTPR